MINNRLLQICLITIIVMMEIILTSSSNEASRKLLLSRGDSCTNDNECPEYQHTMRHNGRCLYQFNVGHCYIRRGHKLKNGRLIFCWHGGDDDTPIDDGMIFHHHSAVSNAYYSNYIKDSSYSTQCINAGF